jgi:hypothetical protein
MAVHEGAGLIDVRHTRQTDSIRGPHSGLGFSNLLLPATAFDHPEPSRDDRTTGRLVAPDGHGTDRARTAHDSDLSLDGRVVLRHPRRRAGRRRRGLVRMGGSRVGPDVHLTDVSQGLSGVHLAGPRPQGDPLRAPRPWTARTRRFTYLETGSAHTWRAFPACSSESIRGSWYERHSPAPCAEDLWDALIEAGQPHGIQALRPIEPQRVLTGLQKMHSLVCQDTDAESNPLEAAMPWIVKRDKEEELHRRWRWSTSRSAGREQAGGFTMATRGDRRDERRGGGERGTSPVGRVHLLALLPPSSRKTKSELAWSGPGTEPHLLLGQPASRRSPTSHTTGYDPSGAAANHAGW